MTFKIINKYLIIFSIIVLIFFIIPYEFAISQDIKEGIAWLIVLLHQIAGLIEWKPEDKKEEISE